MGGIAGGVDTTCGIGPIKPLPHRPTHSLGADANNSPLFLPIPDL